MTLRRFTLLLAIISLTSLIIVNLTRDINSVLQQNYTLSVWSIVMFTMMCSIMYPFSVLALNSSNKLLFTNMTFMFMFMKMLFSVVIILVYQWKFHPTNYFFVLPFFAIYTIFTVFEVYFMMKLVAEKKMQKG